MKSKKQLRVLVTRIDRIGDVVLSTPIPPEIKKANPNSYVAVLVKKYTKDIYLNNPYVDEIILFDGEDAGEPKTFWQLITEVRKFKFTHAFMLLPNEKLNWILFISGIPNRIGVGHNGSPEPSPYSFRATITVAMTESAIPQGFRPIAIRGEFLKTVGPMYGRWDGERVRLGFRVEERHANIARGGHGGMLATFADMQMAVVTHYQWPEIAGHSFPTISMTTDFVAPAPMGAWVEGSADVIRATRSLVFIQGTATVDGATVLRFSAVYKIGPKRDYANPRDPFGLLPIPSRRK